MTESRKGRILIADDNPVNQELLEAYLADGNYEIEFASDGLETLAKVSTFRPDVILLDIMMPKLSGFEVCEELKKSAGTQNVMILMVTALSDLGDIERAVAAGCDDYLSKPFALDELRVRIEALARRGQVYQGEQTSFGNLVLDKSGCALRVGENSCPLSNREYQLIELFMRNPRMYFSADTLLDRVWGMDADVEYGTVWVHISGLRKKLETLGADVEIRSKRGVGYALEETE